MKCDCYAVVWSELENCCYWHFRYESWIIQKLLLMNSVISPLTNKRRYVQRIVRQCILLPQLVDLRGGWELARDWMASEAISRPCFETFLPWVMLGAQQGEPCTVATTQPALLTTCSCEAAVSGQVLDSFGSLVSLWKLCLFDLEVRFCLEMLLVNSTLLTHTSLRSWLSSKAINLSLSVMC